MVGSSKILTVSYGTFSCTLEGFDESFETMKAIAEYFRDLAADDRYFGAEPPTPDADMLARIAEREIARRVEAHEHEGRIVLRAQDNTAAGKALASALTAAPDTVAEHEPKSGEAPPSREPEPSAAPEPEAETAAAPEPEAGDAPEQEPAPEPEVALEPETETAPEPAPDTLAEITAEITTETAPAPDAEPEPEPGEPAAPDALMPESLEREEGVDLSEVPEDAGDDAARLVVQQADDAGTPPPVAQADNLSARLDLIRSVVGASDSYDEDEHAQDFTDAAGADRMTWDDADDGEDDDPAVSGQDAVEATEDTVAKAEAGHGRDAATEPEGTSLFEDTLAALLADAAPGDAQAADEAAPDAPATQAATGAAETPPQEATDTRGARVLKVSRADVEAAREGGLLDATDEDGQDTVNIFGDEAGVLSPEDEADLQRELANLDAELGADIADEAEAEAETEAEPPVAVDSSTAPEPEPEAQAPTGKRTEVSRIFDETDSQMADPGSVRRRNTIQHLRAALAATRAEKAAGADLAKKVDASPYRGDLDAAVRPRRAIPAPDAPRSSRPEEPRPAPLKLVAEQRVDKPQAPVRPRRVATTPQAEVAEAQDKDFSAFAEELGATSLPDLLEAAAAYLADVEGRNQFSRPMLMGKLREIDEEGFSREDGLRSFGQLLREGKLQKLSGGRFSVTEETEFRTAAQRRAG
ncbi:MAG: hypothetical protein U5K36_15190 [Roseovarius sp.]|nr:hypothetical protein [Roseovarius sp.]